MTRSSFPLMTAAAMKMPLAATPVRVSNASPTPLANLATPIAATQAPLVTGPFVPLTIAIVNTGTEPDRLLGGETTIARGLLPCDARHVPPTLLPGGIALPAGVLTILEPGFETLVLIDLTRDLAQGQTVGLTLRLARAGEMTVVARVRRKQDAAGVAPLPAISAGSITVLHVSLPPATMIRLHK